VEALSNINPGLKEEGMKKTRIGVLATFVMLAVGTSLLATMDAQKQFAAKYPEAKALAKCSTCHTKPLPKKDDHEVNAYGKDLAKNLVEGKKGQYDFAKVEKLDSDGDGVSNIDEIKKGTNPGDPKSK
jgi:hypothetical protein